MVIILNSLIKIIERTKAGNQKLEKRKNGKVEVHEEKYENKFEIYEKKFRILNPLKFT